MKLKFIARTLGLLLLVVLFSARPAHAEPVLISGAVILTAFAATCTIAAAIVVGVLNFFHVGKRGKWIGGIMGFLFVPLLFIAKMVKDSSYHVTQVTHQGPWTVKTYDERGGGGKFMNLYLRGKKVKPYSAGAENILFAPESDLHALYWVGPWEGGRGNFNRRPSYIFWLQNEKRMSLEIKTTKDSGVWSADGKAFFDRDRTVYDLTSGHPLPLPKTVPPPLDQRDTEAVTYLMPSPEAFGFLWMTRPTPSTGPYRLHLTKLSDGSEAQSESLQEEPSQFSWEKTSQGEWRFKAGSQ